MKERVLFVLTCLLLWAGIATAQTKRITGVVVSDDDGEPIIGASVLVKGTQIGTITNIEGEFIIPNAPSTAKTLIVSYVGLKTAEIVITSGKMTISLQSDDKVLDEVVVTAMGISREKKSLGYAIQEVKADELTKAGSPSITNSLSGKVAGVQINTFGGSVGASSRIAIRGNGSLANDQQPLIVVNGIPIANDTQRTGDNTYNGVDYGSGLNDINPEDIESISVLKGGSAAIYGMRAGNGVILITTKSGKNANGVQINYDMSLTVDHVISLPRLQNSYGQGYQGDEYHYNLLGNGMSYQQYAQSKAYDYASGVQVSMDESWGPRLDVGLNLTQFDSDGVATPWVSHPNNVRDFFRTGITQNHVISIEAKSEKAMTRASISYRDQKGTVPNTEQKKYSAQLNTHLELNKYIAYESALNYTRTESPNLISQGYGNNPINSLMLWNGRQMNMKSLKANWDQKDDQGNYTYYNWIDYYHMNPYFSVNMNTNSGQRDRIFTKQSLFYTPFEWLKFEGRVGFDFYDNATFEKHYMDRGDWPDGGFLETQTKNSELNADFIATANKTFGDFNLTGILGANYRDVNWQYHSNGANALVVRGVYTIANKVGDAVNTMDHSRVRSNSIYGNFSLGWRNQLYLDASARNDWSSTINDDFFYPSISLSWIPTESFAKLKGDFLSFWKLRAGWAKVGSATSPYRNSYYYYALDDSFNGVPQMYRSNTYPNFGLKPEMITTWEIGTELVFLQNRIHLDVAYYQKKTEDQILTVTTGNTIGFTSMLANAGRIDNKGIEIQLSTNILQSKRGLNWTSTLNFAKDRSKVVSLYPGLNQYRIGWTWGISTMATVGEKWGDLVGTGYDRVNQKDVDDGLASKNQIGAIKVNANGKPTSKAAQILGNVNPDYMMGWRNDFAIKDFRFGFMLDFRKGGDIWSQSMDHGYLTGTAKYTAKNGIRERAIVPGVDIYTNERFVMQDANGKWVKNNITTDAQTLFESWGINEAFIFKGSFLKLREVYFTWNIPQNIIHKTKYFKRANISLIANNAALLWVDKSNTMRLDPEVGGVSSDSRGIGFEQASTPTSRSIGFKLGLTF